jgi:hypothetical protein
MYKKGLFWMRPQATLLATQHQPKIDFARHLQYRGNMPRPVEYGNDAY